jgi:hypothetical protein
MSGTARESQIRCMVAHGIGLGQERKFVLSADAAVEFLSTASRWLDPEIHDTARPVAYTRTTYLDTEDLHYYRSCLDGPIARRLRVREYAAAASPDGVPELTGFCALELKESAGQVRNKIRVLTTPEALPESLPLLLRDLGTGVPDAFVAPRLTTWYRRMSLHDGTGELRVTMDDQLRFCRPALLGRGPAEPESTVGRFLGCILEVKWTVMPPWLARLLESYPEEPMFSKFQLGMAALDAQEAQVAC